MLERPPGCTWLPHHQARIAQEKLNGPCMTSEFEKKNCKNIQLHRCFLKAQEQIVFLFFAISTYHKLLASSTLFVAGEK